MAFPSFTNPNSDRDVPNQRGAYANYKQKGLSLNKQHHLVGLWVVNKKLALTSSYGFAQTSYVPTLSREIFFDNYPSMRGHIYQGGFRVFIDHFAPLGKYWEIKGGLVSIHTDDFTYQYKEYELNSKLQEVTANGSSRVILNAAFSFGSNRVVNDVLLLSYGIDINVLMDGRGYHVGLVQGAPDEYFSAGDPGSNRETLLDMATARFGLHCLLNLKVGIGILL